MNSSHPSTPGGGGGSVTYEANLTVVAKTASFNAAKTSGDAQCGFVTTNGSMCWEGIASLEQGPPYPHSYCQVAAVDR